MIHDEERAAQAEPGGVSYLPDFTCKGCGHGYYGAREPVHCVKCTSILFDPRPAPHAVRMIEKDARRAMDARIREQVASDDMVRAVLPLWICRACDNPSDVSDPVKCQHCPYAAFVPRPRSAKGLAAAMRLADVSARLRVVLADLSDERDVKWFKMAMQTQRYLRKVMAAVYVAEAGK